MRRVLAGASRHRLVQRAQAGRKDPVDSRQIPRTPTLP